MCFQIEENLADLARILSTNMSILSFKIIYEKIHTITLTFCLA